MPASGNLGVAGRQFWLGPDRAGVTVTFWADSQVIHLLIAGARIKSLRSHLSTHDLELLAASGGRPAGPPPLPPTDPDNGAAEVDRTVNASGLVVKYRFIRRQSPTVGPVVTGSGKETPGMMPSRMPG